MSGMVERVAGAILGEVARAAINAMREPTREMITAALSRGNERDDDLMYHGIWRAMIDAALETQKSPAGRSQRSGIGDDDEQS